MSPFARLLGIPVAAFLLLFPRSTSMGGGTPAPQEGFCVFERIDPHSAVAHVITRTDWLGIAPCADAATFAPRWQRAPENGPSSQLTDTAAAALMDAMRLSFGMPGPNDRFHQRCDRSHTVWVQPGTNPPVRAYTHVDYGQEDAGPGYVPELTGLCCEDAAMMVNSTPASDCRAFDLTSVRARVARARGGWVVLTGGPVTVTPPGGTPFVVPAISADPSDDLAGEYACTVTPLSEIYDRELQITVTFRPLHRTLTYVILSMRSRGGSPIRHEGLMDPTNPDRTFHHDIIIPPSPGYRALEGQFGPNGLQFWVWLGQRSRDSFACTKMR
jgi:hypothetical protein